MGVKFWTQHKDLSRTGDWLFTICMSAWQGTSNSRRGEACWWGRDWRKIWWNVSDLLLL